MANTYTQIHIHYVFAPKYRNATLDKSWRPDLFSYITGIVQNHGHKMLQINGMADHVHMLIGLRPTQAVAEAQQKNAQVMLLDLGLGERSGFEVLQELQRRGAAVKALVLTMSAQPRHVAEAVRLGAAGYVLKDAGAAELMLAIDTVSAGRRYFGPQVADLALQALTSDAPDDPFAILSPRERQIVTMVVNGLSSAAIGSQLHLSPKTVDTYRSRVMAKLGVSGVTSLVRLAVREGLVEK